MIYQAIDIHQEYSSQLVTRLIEGRDKNNSTLIDPSGKHQSAGNAR